MPGLTGGAYSAPPDLAGFKSGGRDKGRRKGETTGGDRQLREEDRNEGRGGRGEGTEESVRRMEAEISQGRQGRPKAFPVMQNALQKFSGGGGKMRKLGQGQSSKLVS